jgi:hypothetical protein
MYKILGADGRQYGPISADQLSRWITEGRANAQTQTLAEGASEWKLLGSLPEFAAHFAPLAPPPLRPSSISSYARQTNSYAVWGMVFGILSLCLCCCCCLNLPLGILGLVFSLIGLSQINEMPDVYEGRGLAIAGIVLSALGLLLAILLLFPGMAHGNFRPPNINYFHTTF